MITAFSTPETFDHLGLYKAFLERETDASGTVVLHHGRVKRPGKKVPDFSKVELKALAPDVDEKLGELARRAAEKFGLNQVLLVHRLGTIEAGDSVLLAIVSAATRVKAFAACAWLVDEVKKEDFIELIELP
jgi:molybdopterin synthase catalytic subunit